MERASFSCAMGGWSMTSSQTSVVTPQSHSFLPYTRPGGDDRRLAVNSPRVLIADDQPDVLEALPLLRKGEGYKIESAGSPAAILDAIDSEEFAAVLMDLNYNRHTPPG